MPRAPRVEFAGAIYHVMNRGDHLEAIFRDAADREVFLRTLGETCRSADWAVHSFVLMGNHYHLLVETRRANLVKGMQYLNSTYTQRFNVRHKLRGHLFQGRYKALLVDVEAAGCFLTVSDYIHLNPVRSGGVREPAELWKDPWNSAGWLGGRRKGCPEWLRWEQVYRKLGLKNWRSRGRSKYRAYLERRMEEVRKDDRRKANERWGSIRRGWCLGSEGFVAEMKEKLEELARKGCAEESWAGEAVEAMEEDLARAALGQGLKRLRCSSVKDLSILERNLLASWLRSRTRVSVGWIARELGVRSVPGMRSAISRTGRLVWEDPRATSLWKRLDCNKTRTDP